MIMNSTLRKLEGREDMMPVTSRVDISATLERNDSSTLFTSPSSTLTALGSRRLVHREAISVRLSTVGTMTVLNWDTEVRAKVNSSDPMNSASTASRMNSSVTKMVVTNRRLIFSFFDRNSAGERSSTEKTNASKKGMSRGSTYLNPKKMRPRITAA